jgi:hypothetical protein
VIKAPVAGSISERLVQPGEFIRVNTAGRDDRQMSPLKLRSASRKSTPSLIHAGQTVESTSRRS